MGARAARGEPASGVGASERAAARRRDAGTVGTAPRAADAAQPPGGEGVHRAAAYRVRPTEPGHHAGSRANPGMRPYSADDAAHFHGRSTEIEELLVRLDNDEREIYVIGPAGSGKSSLVTAGLLPRLARGEPRLGSFVVRTMRPGEHPTQILRKVLDDPDGELGTLGNAIAALLAHRAAGASVLLVIDQLEELFTQVTTAERAAFLTSLQHLRAEPRCVVIFTLRADFVSEFMKSPLWRDQLSRGAAPGPAARARRLQGG